MILPGPSRELEPGLSMDGKELDGQYIYRTALALSQMGMRLSQEIGVRNPCQE